MVGVVSIGIVPSGELSAMVVVSIAVVVVSIAVVVVVSMVVVVVVFDTGDRQVGAGRRT